MVKTRVSVILDNQEKIVSAAKNAIKPYFVSKKITKDDYKVIMKKVVTKVREHSYFSYCDAVEFLCFRFSACIRSKPVHWWMRTG